MSSRFSNKFPIPEKFPEILHDYAREVVRYMPKDILDFSIQYFYSLDQNIPLNYKEGASNDLPKITEAIEQREKTKENRETLSTPSLATNSNTQNMFYKQNEISGRKINKEVNEIKETISSKNNTPIATEESKQESVVTNGSGVVGISKNFVSNIFEKEKLKIKENLKLDKISQNKIESAPDSGSRGEKFNKSGNTFSNISGNSTTKNGIRHFVGDVLTESKKYAIENQKK
jgi:hypothetical protein